MNNHRFSVCFALLVTAAGAGLVFGQAPNGIAVVVNGKVITRAEVREAVQSQEHLIRMTIKNSSEQQAKLANLRDSALYALIEQQLVLSEFEKLGGSIKSQYLDDDINGIIRARFDGDREKFLQELAKTGMTIKKFREHREKIIIVSELRSRKLRNLPPPTPDQVEAFYSRNANKFRDKDYIKFSTITIPKYPVGSTGTTPDSQKNLAEELRAKITGAADFASTAKAYSQDSRAENGGDWGMQERASLNKELADIAFPLKEGAISNVVELSGNYMIIFCEAKQPGTQEPLSKVRPIIEKIIQSECEREALNSWLSSLATKSIIQPDDVSKEFLSWISRQVKEPFSSE